jgi:radical SAM-linked protein
MNRYLIRFRKKGNMRFISHLDIQRLFKRLIKLAQIPVAYSQGFNPHELTNIVQPLSLGFESESEYFEIDTQQPIDMEKALEGLNLHAPMGFEFTGIKETPTGKRNLSSITAYAVYRAEIKPEGRTPHKFHTNDFLAQDKIFIMKRDKKTKSMVEKDVKSMVRSLEQKDLPGGEAFDMLLSCASNATLNPMNLLDSLYLSEGIDLNHEDVRITRIDMLAEKDGKLISAFDFF